MPQTNANDAIFKSVVESSCFPYDKEGFVDDDSFDYYMAKIDYAAFLSEKRASKDNTLSNA